MARLSHVHKGTGDIEKAKRECVRHFLGKERLVERARELVCELESMPEDTVDNYRFCGCFLLERCYSILSNYYYARGIDEALKDFHGDEWLPMFIKEIEICEDRVLNENKAYGLLLKSYFDAGNGNLQKSFDCVEQAARLVPNHSSPYYALGAFYLNLEEYESAEKALETGLAKRKQSDFGESIFPVEDEVLYYMWIAMACIPQGKYRKVVDLLEWLIEERGVMTIEHGAFIYKCLGLCYKALGEKKRASVCQEEVQRLGEELRIS
jgi:tetratricopeptide (TPR) repeat protein